MIPGTGKGRHHPVGGRDFSVRRHRHVHQHKRQLWFVSFQFQVLCGLQLVPKNEGNLKNEHGITITVKTIMFADGLRVSI